MDQGHGAAVSARAYQLWEESGWVHGHHKEHWRQAEREILGDTYMPEKADSVTGMVNLHIDNVRALSSKR